MAPFASLNLKHWDSVGSLELSFNLSKLKIYFYFYLYRIIENKLPNLIKLSPKS